MIYGLSDALRSPAAEHFVSAASPRGYNEPRVPLDYGGIANV